MDEGDKKGGKTDKEIKELSEAKNVWDLARIALKQEGLTDEQIEAAAREESKKDPEKKSREHQFNQITKKP